MIGRSAESASPEPRYTLELTWRGEQIKRRVPIGEAESAALSSCMKTLNRAEVPYAVGGSYALYAYTGGWRNTKDLDIFLEPRHLEHALGALASAGFETEVADRRWLAKAHRPPYLVDLVFGVRHRSSFAVSESWMEACRPAKLLGVPTRLLAPEALIASKVYIAARERFDGADIAHLIRATGEQVDWARVVDLLRGDEVIVFWHLVLFQFVYPGCVDFVPTGLMQMAFDRLRADWKARRDPRAFRGMLIDARAFAQDHELWGYEDGRDERPLVGREGESL